MAKEIKLDAELRSGSGSAEARRLRRVGSLPCVVACEGGGTRHLQVRSHELEQTLRHHTGSNLLIDLNIAGDKVRKVLLKEVQHDPLDGALLHADFLEVSMTKKMRVAIPLELTGEPFGVTQEGGILEQQLRELEVECLPGDMVESIRVDVSELRSGHPLLVRDIAVDAKLTVLTHAEQPVAHIAIPAAEEAAAAPTEEAAATEPELVGKKKEEGEEGEAAPAAEGGAGAAKAAAPAAKKEKKG